MSMGTFFKRMVGFLLAVTNSAAPIDKDAHTKVGKVIGHFSFTPKNFFLEENVTVKLFF